MAATVFFSYSHADEAVRDEIEKQLSTLKRQGVIETWHDRRIGAGEDFAGVIDRHVETDDIILLLVSADFIDSDYCYEREMTRAMERHEAGQAIVIPVILRPCDWHGTPFGRLNATPRDGKPISRYADRDEALLEVTKAVRAAVERLGRNTSQSAAPNTTESKAAPRELPTGPRSSNLALRKTFSDRDKDRFKHDSFEYMAKFFANSLEELGARNEGIEGDFRRIDAQRFTSTIYRNGRVVSKCTIFIGDRFADGIAYSSSETLGSNSYNELLTVEADDQALFLRGLGLSRFGDRSEVAKLSQEGGSELYWGLLIAPLQAEH